MACKSITTEVEDYEIKVGLTQQNQEALYEIKRRFTNELTSLLSATKSFSSGMGISPVSLLDASAGNLTETIVDLVKLLGMKPIHDLEDGIQSLSILKTATDVKEVSLLESHQSNMTSTALSVSD